MGQGIYDDDGKVEALEGIVLDISDRKAAEGTLKYNNEHDRWTGLHNREYLVSLLEKDIRMKRDSKKALIGINLDTLQVKASNYGFHYSQNLVKKAAEALSRYCTDKRLLCHARENRFAFYISDYDDRSEIAEFANAIVKTLRSVFATERTGGGIGILEIGHGEDVTDVELLMRRLLIASERYVGLFENDFQVCCYDEELEDLVNRERDIVEALSAIASGSRTNDELLLLYQPIVDLKSYSVQSFEVLSRLRSEKLGPVSPMEFIPIAEKTKLILPVGEIVIVKAFRFLNRLRELGYEEICISVNISVIQLLDPDFVNRLLELAGNMHIDPDHVVIEITESVFASDFNHINSIIGKLKKSGFHIAIDDFGTGYSSLARQRELHVDCMKIDKYFIDKLDTDLDRSITSDIISVAHKLGHCTVAEGVEKETQLQYLKEHGCDKVQGFLISRPITEEDVVRFLENEEKMSWNAVLMGTR